VKHCGRNFVKIFQRRCLGFRSLHIISEGSAFGKIICIQIPDSDTCQNYRYFSSQMFEAFPAQILTFFEKTFRCLILSQAIINIRTDLLIGLFPSGVGCLENLNSE